MKSLDFNSIPANDFNESFNYKVNRFICRLCAKSAEGQSKSIPELNSTLHKCLPTIRLDTTDNLPDKICADCIRKLVQFSLFIDRIASVQKDLFGIDETDGSNDCLKESATKPIIIKQEPIANIKQEIFEYHKSTKHHAEDIHPYNGSGQDYYADADADAYCEFCDVYFINNVELKNHIVDFHSDKPCNPQEVANNCEIMEIITLENATFIDLDENCVEEGTIPEATVPQLQHVLKVEKTTDMDQRDILIQTISVDHSYARKSCSIDSSENNSIVRDLKQEEVNVQENSLTQTTQSEQMDEPAGEPIDYMESVEPYCEIVEYEHPIEKCPKCIDIFENRMLLNEHMQTVHIPKTKICPICTAHCGTICHYFIHRRKYHNWKKPRRVKRKLHFKCSDCCKMFMSKFAFENHSKYFCAKLRFECSICHLEFSSGMSMLIHKRICKILMARSETIGSQGKIIKKLKTHSNRMDINTSVIQRQKVCLPDRQLKSVS